MPRIARVVLPNIPHHIIHRGHNKQQVFYRESDYRFYLKVLQETRLELGCKVYAYCLMTNHVHLILDPGETPIALGALMKQLAGIYTQYFNRRYKRVGTLWEGRYRSSPIDSENYLLACTRYIELNPLRAGMVKEPEAYDWSSLRAKIGLAASGLLDGDEIYLGLGDTAAERIAVYKNWIRDIIPQGQWEAIRQAAASGKLTGDRCFVDAVERDFGRRIEFRGPGRPSASKR